MSEITLDGGAITTGLITTEPETKMFSLEYVQTIREENKDRRAVIKAKDLELATLKSKVKSLIGLKDEEEVDDSKLTAFTKQQNDKITQVMEKANARLIQAEIKSLDGYDTKLVEKLIDKSTVVIAEDGTSNIKTLVEALAIEFPVIKQTQAPGGSNPPPASVKTAQSEYDEAYRQAMAHPRDSDLMRKVFLAKEKLNGG